MKHFFLSILMAMSVSLSGAAQTLQGVVMLNDSTPAAFATIYIPSINRGAAANELGQYSLDELPEGKLLVEYSCMGQQTIRRDLQLAKGETFINNETLSEKLILLPPSIVTRDGEDPAHYVLRHVWEQAKVNRKRIDAWQAEVKYEFGLNDIEMFVKIIPKKYITLFKFAAGLVGFRKLFTLVINHPSIKAKVSLVRTYAKGKSKDSEQKIVYCSENLTPDEQKTLYSNKLLVDPNLFDEVYSDTNDWGPKGEDRDKFTLAGSYELDGKNIDVLEYVKTTTREYDKVNEQGDTIKVKKTRTSTTTLHVVEDVWGILKVERNSTTGHELSECRDLGGGIYMPISSSLKFKLPVLKSEELPKKIEELEAEDKSKMNKTERKVYEAFIEQLKLHQGRDVVFELNFSYDIKYRYFKVK